MGPSTIRLVGHRESEYWLVVYQYWGWDKDSDLWIVNTDPGDIEPQRYQTYADAAEGLEGLKRYWPNDRYKILHVQRSETWKAFSR